MTDNNVILVTDHGKDHVGVEWQHHSQTRLYPSPIPFTDPLSVEDRRELRWYLEEYLQFPYGAEKYRAKKVEKKMAAWGQSLFSQVFTKAKNDPDPRQLYQEAVREGLEKCEICISSDDPVLLSIPWELLRDLTPGRGFLAPLLGGLYRQHIGYKIEVPTDASKGEPFRVLLVVARPYGEKDVPFGMVARAIVEALRPLRPRVEIDILRPPTFKNLVECLDSKRGYYNLIHFDGHGGFEPTFKPASILLFSGKEGMGHLLFEKEDTSPNEVTSEDLGQALAEGIAKSGKYDFVFSCVACDVRNRTLIECMSPAGVSDFTRDWTGLFDGKGRFATFTHQQFVSWVRKNDSNDKWKDWLSYIEERYGY